MAKNLRMLLMPRAGQSVLIPRAGRNGSNNRWAWVWVVAVILIGAAVRPGFALDKLNWAPRNHAVLAQFLREHGKVSPAYDAQRPPYAVFDWDDTSAFHDCGEALFRHQLWNLKFRLDPDEFRSFFKAAYRDVKAHAGSRQVKLGDLIGGGAIQRTEHRAIRVHKVQQRRAFAQEVGVRDHREVDGLGLVACISPKVGLAVPSEPFYADQYALRAPPKAFGVAPTKQGVTFL